MKNRIRKVLYDFRYKGFSENKIGQIAKQVTFSDLIIKVHEVRPGVWESD